MISNITIETYNVKNLKRDFFSLLSNEFVALFFDTNNSFLTYKSIGVVRDYINRNRDELKKIMAENTLDSLIIYEVDGYFSPELQYIDLNSMAVIIDSEMNLLYMDHQSQGFDIDEWDREMVKKILLDKISQRLIHSLESLDYLEKN